MFKQQDLLVDFTQRFFVSHKGVVIYSSKELLVKTSFLLSLKPALSPIP